MDEQAELAHVLVRLMMQLDELQVQVDQIDKTLRMLRNQGWALVRHVEEKKE